MKLEEIARQSSDAARASVVHLDPPPIAEKTAVRRPHMPALIGVAALLLVVAVASAVIISNDGDGSGDSDTIAAAPDVPRLGLPELSAWTPAGAADLADFDAGEQGRFAYYGQAGADDPFADGDLLLLTMAGATDESMGFGEGSTVSVRGTTGIVADGEAEGLPAGTTVLQWVHLDEPGAATGIGIGLVSRSFDADQLLAIAETLSIEGNVVSPGEDLGLDRLTTTSGTPLSFAGAQSAGFVVWYTSAAGDDASLAIMSRAGDIGSERISLQWWAANLDDVTVNGRPGALTKPDGTAIGNPGLAAHTLVWSPAPGTVATLSYTGTDADIDLVAMAESAIELDDETWAKYFQLSNQPATADFTEIYGEGSATVGTTTVSWVLGLQDASLCFQANSDNSGVGSCQDGVPGLGDAGPARTIDNNFSEDHATVVIMGSLDVEQIVETTGAGSIDEIQAAGSKWFVYVGEPDHQPSFNVIVDGKVVDTLEAGVDGEEATIEVPSFDIAANPSAQALGIVDDFAMVGGDGGGDVPWALGRVGNELCLVTDGEAVSAGCAVADDIVVYKPVQLNDGQDRTFIVLTDTPDCLFLQGVSAVTTVATTGFGDETAGYTVLTLDGVADAWQLLFTDNSDADVWIDVPDVEGTTVWPSGIC